MLILSVDLTIKVIIMNRKNISAFLLASSIFTGLSLNTNSASAASLGASCLFVGTASGDYLFDRGTDKDAFKNDCNSTEIGVVEGRAGTAGTRGDYEVGIGLNGAQADLADQLQLDWVDETVYDWTLDWNSLDNIATFTVGGNSINYDFDLSDSQNLELDKFNAFGIQARADNPGTFITEGTEITLNINSMTFNSNPEGINNSSVTDNPNLTVSAISDANSPNIFDEFYTINAGASELNSVNSEITSMSGTFVMDIPDGDINPQDADARSRIGFQILLFDPPANSESVPESTSILSLLGLGVLALRKR